MNKKLPAIVAEILIDRRPDHVWAVMTSEASVANWLGCMRYEKRVGAVFYMQQDRDKAARDDISGATHCEILALEEPTLFKFSWFVPGFPATHVSVRLSAHGDGSRVVLEHDGWDQFEPDAIKAIRDMLDGGWRSFVLPNLKRAAEA